MIENEENPINSSWANAIPPEQGLYNPELEKDACGKKEKSPF